MKFIGLIRPRGAPGKMPLQIELGERKSATRALKALMHNLPPWIRKMKTEYIVVCSKADAEKFLAPFREPRYVN